MADDVAELKTWWRKRITQVRIVELDFEVPGRARVGTKRELPIWIGAMHAAAALAMPPSFTVMTGPVWLSIRSVVARPRKHYRGNTTVLSDMGEAHPHPDNQINPCEMLSVVSASLERVLWRSARQIAEAKVSVEWGVRDSSKFSVRGWLY